MAATLFLDLTGEKAGLYKGLNSEAILADAACTRTRIQLSVVLLLASLGYEITGIGGIDSAGALLIAGLSFIEGREAFEKAEENMVCACRRCR